MQWSETFWRERKRISTIAGGIFATYATAAVFTSLPLCMHADLIIKSRKRRKKKEGRKAAFPTHVGVLKDELD